MNTEKVIQVTLAWPFNFSLLSGEPFSFRGKIVGKVLAYRRRGQSAEIEVEIEREKIDHELEQYLLGAGVDLGKKAVGEESDGESF